MENIILFFNFFIEVEEGILSFMWDKIKMKGNNAC